MFYTDAFIDKVQDYNGLRLASKTEITAMKGDVVQRTGRKKDFWDFDRLRDDFTIDEMFELHEKIYPYTHDRALLNKNSRTSHRRMMISSLYVLEEDIGSLSS